MLHLFMIPRERMIVTLIFIAFFFIDYHRPELLLELAHLCSEFNQPELLKMCIDGLKTLPIKVNSNRFKTFLLFLN